MLARMWRLYRADHPFNLSWAKRVCDKRRESKISRQRHYYLFLRKRGDALTLTLSQREREFVTHPLKTDALPELDAADHFCLHVKYLQVSPRLLYVVEHV